MRGFKEGNSLSGWFWLAIFKLEPNLNRIQSHSLNELILFWMTNPIESKKISKVLPIHPDILKRSSLKISIYIFKFFACVALKLLHVLDFNKKKWITKKNHRKTGAAYGMWRRRNKKKLVTDVVDKYCIMLSSSYWGSRMERGRDKARQCCSLVNKNYYDYYHANYLSYCLIINKEWGTMCYTVN